MPSGLSFLRPQENSKQAQNRATVNENKFISLLVVRFIIVEQKYFIRANAGLDLIYLKRVWPFQIRTAA
jgi:hypothetical protein